MPLQQLEILKQLAIIKNSVLAIAFHFKQLENKAFSIKQNEPHHMQTLQFVALWCETREGMESSKKHLQTIYSYIKTEMQVWLQHDFSVVNWIIKLHIY